MGELQKQIDAIIDALNKGQRMEDIMRQDEREAGRRVVLPGEEPWLSANDWDPTITVSVDGKTVRLVAILAKHPGNGAFRRLVAAVRSAGLTPCIITPTREMRATVQRWGWQRYDVGAGWDYEEQWRPCALVAT